MNRDLKNLISFGVAVLALLMFGLIIKFKEQVIHYGYIFLTVVFIVIYIIIIILVLAIIVYVFKRIKRYFQKENKNQSQKIIYRVEPKVPIRKTWPYRKKDYLFSVAELKFYKILRQIIHSEFTIFAKVRLADVVYIPKHYSNNKYNFYRIQAKHIDYLICRSNRVEPLVAIELDDSSHNTPDRQKRDKFLEDMLEDAKLPLIRIKVSSSYDIESIKKQLKNILIY